MLITTINEWERSEKSGLISVGSYSLFVRTGGPPRRPGAPVVIFITGGGAPTESYVHLHYELSKFARNYFFDRAGYGRSERPNSDERDTGDKHDLKQAPVQTFPLRNSQSHAGWALGGTINPSPTHYDALQPSTGGSKSGRAIWAKDSASELDRLMRAINVEPPFVLAAHSYGGMIARTYYDLFPDHVAGIALLDTNSELLQQCLSPIPPPAYQNVVANVDPEQVLHLREASGMSDAEWEAAVAATVRTMPASADETTHGSGRALARRMQMDHQAMGNKPLLVMRSNMAADLKRLFEAGVGLGDGTKEERQEAEWWLKSFELYFAQVSRVQLELSRNAEHVYFEDVGHDFPIRVPERTAEVVRRLLSMVTKYQTAKK